MNWDTPAELVAAWDRGEPIPTVEMGGISPGYEQAIQVLVVELLRSCKPPLEGQTNTWGDDVVDRIDDACGGFSGAQVLVAKNLAASVFHRGMRAVRDGVSEDRRIMVSNAWPRYRPTVAGKVEDEAWALNAAYGAAMFSCSDGDEVGVRARFLLNSGLFGPRRDWDDELKKWVLKGKSIP